MPTFCRIAMTGEELRQRRHALGLSQGQLAVALRRHHDTISRWERGTRRIESPGVLRFLLAALSHEKSLHGADRQHWLDSLPTFLDRDQP
jgi:transcriptional regulator with XRE-family HTH domain